MAAASAIWLLLLDRERPKQKPLAHGRAGDKGEASRHELFVRGVMLLG
jgi:hypothetical protein